MTDFLTTYASTQPDKLAVVDDRPGGQVQRWTYAQLEQQANRLANAFTTLGMQPGDKIVWCGPNSLPVVACINAARKIGATAVPLNYRLTPTEAAYITDHSDALIVFVDAEHAATFQQIRSQVPKVAHVIVFDGPALDGMLSADELTDAASAEPPPAELAAGFGGTMIYTSGTTGLPKGAFRAVGSDPAPVLALIAKIGYSGDDVYLTTGPLYHSGPGGFMSSGQSMGQTIVVQRKFDAEDWLRLVDTYGVTSTFSAPTPIRLVCRLPDEVIAKYDTSSMKRMLANAAPWSYALKKQYLSHFPADSLWEVYGSTELSVNCILEPQDQLRKPGSCGKPAPGVEIKLVDDDGRDVTETGVDHPGELYVRSTIVFNDYYKDHDRFQADTMGEYHTVGDIAYRDDEGYFYICDRKKDMIISGGVNIYPAEIEAALDQHPDIYDAAVFGIPSEEWGEAVHAAIVVRPGATLSVDDVIAFARDHIASYKIPRSVQFVDELPRTGSGKILKREMRAPFWADHDTQVGS